MANIKRNAFLTLPDIGQQLTLVVPTADLGHIFYTVMNATYLLSNAFAPVGTSTAAVCTSEKDSTHHSIHGSVHDIVTY